LGILGRIKRDSNHSHVQVRADGGNDHGVTDPDWPRRQRRKSDVQDCNIEGRVRPPHDGEVWLRFSPFFITDYELAELLLCLDPTSPEDRHTMVVTVHDDSGTVRSLEGIYFGGVYSVGKLIAVSIS
jgi:hypothetical protein